MPDYSNHSELQNDLVEHLLGGMDLKVLEQYVREDLHYRYDDLVEHLLGGMDLKVLEQYVREDLHHRYKNYSYEELLVEADDYGLEVQELIPPETDN